MTNIEKSTISISKAAAVTLVVAGFVAQYFTTQNAVKEGFSKFREEVKSDIKELQGEDRLIRQEFKGLDKKVDDIQYAITSYIGKAILPTEPKLEERRRR